MNIIIFGSNIDQLRAAKELVAPDTALLRDPLVWAGEVEQCDAVMYLDPETRQDLLDAYGGIDVLEAPAQKKQSRKKPKDANGGDQGGDGFQSGEDAQGEKEAIE